MTLSTEFPPPRRHVHSKLYLYTVLGEMLNRLIVTYALSTRGLPIHAFNKRAPNFVVVWSRIQSSDPFLE